MKTATLTETKNSLSALVDQVQQGESVLILDRGRPVARLESVLNQAPDPDGRIARLERQGLIRRPTQPLPKEFFSNPPLRLPAGVSVLEALLEERRNGR
jgi:prevent-host-death family protein